MGGKEFYSTSAQVIPIVFLAIAVELHFLKFGDPGRKAGPYREFAKTFLPLLLFFIPGEAAALAALQSENPSDLYEDIVEVDLLWAIGYFLLVSIADWTREGAAYASKTQDPSKFQAGIVRLGWLVTPSLLAALIAASVWVCLH